MSGFAKFFGDLFGFSLSAKVNRNVAKFLMCRPVEAEHHMHMLTLTMDWEEFNWTLNQAYPGLSHFQKTELWKELSL